jgi:hypothetical protein
MRISIKVGDINKNNVVVVGGPHKSKSRGTSTKWDFLCPYCNNTFLAPTTNFTNSKSCYSCRGEVLKSYSEETTLDYLYYVVKGRKSSKEKGFGLTKEVFKKVSKMNCYYCGDPPKMVAGYKEWHPKVLINGLDRIDSSVGYYDNNVVSCCKICNLAKLDNSREDFLKWVKRIATYQNM